MEMTPSDITELCNHLDSLEKEDSNSNYSKIKNTLYFNKIPSLFFSLPKGYKFARNRFVKNTDKALPKKIDQVGHRLNRFDIETFGRCNEPYQKIFYCSTNPDSSFVETIPFKEEKTQVIYSITSIWEAGIDLNLTGFHIQEDLNKQNEFIRKVNKRSKSAIENSIVNQDIGIINLWQYFSEKFAEKESKYLITAAISNYLLNNDYTVFPADKSAKIDGIFYKSVHWEQKGLNLALRTEIIEDKKLILKKVISKKFVLDSNLSYSQVNERATKNIDYDKWEINWD